MAHLPIFFLIFFVFNPNCGAWSQATHHSESAQDHVIVLKTRLSRRSLLFLLSFFHFNHSLLGSGFYETKKHFSKKLKERNYSNSFSLKLTSRKNRGSVTYFILFLPRTVIELIINLEAAVDRQLMIISNT